MEQPHQDEYANLDKTLLYEREEEEKQTCKKKEKKKTKRRATGHCPRRKAKRRRGMFRKPRVTSIETLLICYKKEILALPEKKRPHS